MNEREETLRTLKAMIVRLGDKSSSIEDSIEDVVKQLDKEVNNFHNELVDTIVECGRALAVKSSIYATVVGLLSVRKPSFGDRVVTKTAMELSGTIEKSQYLDARSLLRFIVELTNANVISPVSLVHIFNTLLDLPLDEKYSQNTRCNKDVLVYLVLASFPWCGRIRCDLNSEPFQPVWDKLEQYFSGRSADREAPSILQSLQKSPADKEEDEDEERGEAKKEADFVVQLYEHSINHWKREKREDRLTSRTSEGFEEQLSPIEPIKLNDGHLNVSEWRVDPGNKRFYFPYLRTSFRIFSAREYASNEDGNDQQTFLQKFVLNAYMIDIINNFESNHKEAVRLLTSLTNSSKLIIGPCV